MRRVLQNLSACCFLPVLAFAALKPVSEPEKLVGEFMRDDAVTEPHAVLQRARLEYPAELRRQGVGGTAKLVFIVNERGEPEQVQCVAATDKAFAKAAVACVKQWKFRPARHEGRPVRVRTEQVVTFAMR